MDNTSGLLFEILVIIIIFPFLPNPIEEQQNTERTQPDTFILKFLLISRTEDNCLIFVFVFGIMDGMS